MCVCVCGGGITLIYSYIRRLGPFVWDQNFTYQYFLFFIFFFFGGGGGGGGSRKLWFCGYFWCHHKTWLVLGVISMYCRSFLKVKVQNGNIFGGLLKFQILFWVCLIFLIFLGVNSRCWAACVSRKKWEEYPHPTPGHVDCRTGQQRIQDKMWINSSWSYWTQIIYWNYSAGNSYSA